MYVYLDVFLSTEKPVFGHLMETTKKARDKAKIREITLRNFMNSLCLSINEVLSVRVNKMHRITENILTCALLNINYVVN